MSKAKVIQPGEGTRIDFPGSSVLVKARGRDDFSVLELIAEPGDQGPVPHVHRCHEELFFVLEGAFEFLLDDQRVQAGPGSFVRVPPGVLHGFTNVASGRSRWLGIASPGGLEDALADMAREIALGTLDAPALAALGDRYDTTHRLDLAAGRADGRLTRPAGVEG